MFSAGDRRLGVTLSPARNKNCRENSSLRRPDTLRVPGSVLSRRPIPQAQPIDGSVSSFKTHSIVNNNTFPLPWPDMARGGRSLVAMRWGLGSEVVEQATQGIAASDVQRARRDGDDQAVLPRTLQKQTMSHAGLWLLRVGEDLPSGKQPWYFTARDGSPVLTVAGLWDEMEKPARPASASSRVP